MAEAEGLRIRVFRSGEVLGEGHGHGPWTKGLAFCPGGLWAPQWMGGAWGRWDLHAQRGWGEELRGPDQVWVLEEAPGHPGRCSSSLSGHLPLPNPPALGCGVRFGPGLGLLKARLHFTAAPGRGR